MTSFSASPSGKNLNTVLGIIDKSLNSLRNSSVVDRVAQDSSPRAILSGGRSRGGSPYGTPRAAKTPTSGGRQSRRTTPRVLSATPRLSTPGSDMLAAASASGAIVNAAFSESKGEGDMYFNSLTTELLNTQKKCAALEEENLHLKSLRKRQKAAGSPRKAGMRGTSPYQPRGGHVEPRAEDDITSVMGQIHDHLALQSQDFALRRMHGECVVDHQSMQMLIDLVGESLHHLSEDEMTRTDWLQQQATEMAHNREVARTAEFEIKEPRESEDRLKEELEAFEAENMRLTNELADERHKNNERGRDNEQETASMIALQSQASTLSAEREQLLQQLQSAETRITRFVNEIDELRNNEKDLLNQIKALQRNQK